MGSYIAVILMFAACVLTTHNDVSGYLIRDAVELCGDKGGMHEYLDYIVNDMVTCSDGTTHKVGL